jgi:predicted PhzF superfamily epimerase YddE/YHI9
MQISIYHVDAFTDKVFSGNPAAVCVLSEWLPDNILQGIAKENNLPATAFLVREDDKFNIRWITPESERLNKIKLHARQVSQRGGEMFCQYLGDRVLISGRVVMYMQGVITHDL